MPRHKVFPLNRLCSPTDAAQRGSCSWTRFCPIGLVLSPAFRNAITRPEAVSPGWDGRRRDWSSRPDASRDEGGRLGFSRSYSRRRISEEESTIMTRIDYRSWASVGLFAAVLFYVGCSTSSTTAPSSSSASSTRKNATDAPGGTDRQSTEAVRNQFRGPKSCWPTCVIPPPS